MPHLPSRGSAPAGRTASSILVTLLVAVAYVAGLHDMDGPVVALGLALLGASLVLTVRVVPWRRLPGRAQLAIPLGVIAFIMIMEILALPDHLDATVLLLGPVLWTALYGSIRQTALVTGLVVACIVGLETAEMADGVATGVSEWAEVVALCGIAMMLGYFTATSRVQAQTDDLTGLPNRRAWDQVLDGALERAHAGRADLVVAMIDLDLFKQYNDLNGHGAGDDHLAECAHAWVRQLRRTDTIARVGGEEFAVLLPVTDAHTARGLLQRLMDATPNDESCSIGAAAWNRIEGARHLTARADRALYAAKDLGRAQVVVATNSGTNPHGRHAPETQTGRPLGAPSEIPIEG